VAARFCPYCGSTVVSGGTFCPSCGANLTATATAPGSPGASPMFAPPGGAPIPPGVPPSVLYAPKTAETRGVDLDALSKVATAAAVGLISEAVGLIALFATPSAGLFTISMTPAGTTISANTSGLEVFGLLIAVGTLLTVIELLYYRGAFKTLEGTDGRFKTPSTLVLVLLIALPFVLLGLLGLVYAIYNAIACAGAGNPISPSCLSGGGLLAVLGLLLITGILAVIGYIGLLVGIWRLGTRYDASGFKVGAILILIPLLNVVGAILILVSARSARERFAAPGPPTTFG
jgi:hypothetical protein